MTSYSDEGSVRTARPPPCNSYIAKRKRSAHGSVFYTTLLLWAQPVLVRTFRVKCKYYVVVNITTADRYRVLQVNKYVASTCDTPY